MTVYGLRHTFATIMRRKGMDKEVLKELMEHSDYDTTNSYYIHVDEEWKLEECRRIEQQIGKSNNKKKAVRYTRTKPHKVKRKIKIPKIA